MKNTSFIQKLSLFLFGVVLALVLLEAGLRIAGGLVLLLQERHNHVSFGKNEYRILCLGESTTALGGEDSYPSQLEQMLNRQSRQVRFSVINKGIISTTSSYILAHVDQNLDLFKPQMVIVMMGINDKAYLHDPYKSLWWENIKAFLKELKVYKLAHLLYEHITHRIREVKGPVQAFDLSSTDGNYAQVENFLKVLIARCIEQYREDMQKQEIQAARQARIEAGLACIELAQRYRLQGLLPEAQRVLEQATVIDPSSAELYIEWGELYLAQEKSAEALKAFQAALAFDPKNGNALLGLAHAYYQLHNDNAFLVYDAYLQVDPKDYWGHIELARWLRENKHLTQAQGVLIHAIAIGPEFDEAFVDLGQILDDQGQYQNEESFYLKEISLHPQRPRLYQALGQFYRSRGKEDLAEEYLHKSAQGEVAAYYPATLVNYSLLLDKILSRHIKVVVMQYPVREIGPLKDYLGQRNGLIYVENRENFVKALGLGSYHQYFKDNFAYNFGHCTREGNALIASHLLEVILKNE